MSRCSQFAPLLAACSLTLSIMTLLTVWFGGSSLLPNRNQTSSEWRTPTASELQGNGWRNESEMTSKAGFYFGDGRVYLRGTITPLQNRAKGSSTLFTLSQGFRPTRIVSFLVPVDERYGEVRIFPSGEVVAYLPFRPRSVSLDGVSFRLW